LGTIDGTRFNRMASPCISALPELSSPALSRGSCDPYLLAERDNKTADDPTCVGEQLQPIRQFSPLELHLHIVEGLHDLNRSTGSPADQAQVEEQPDEKRHARTEDTQNGEGDPFDDSSCLGAVNRRSPFCGRRLLRGDETLETSELARRGCNGMPGARRGERRLAIPASGGIL
jgi:hypothetical protein